MFNLNSTDFYWKFPEDKEALFVIAGVGEITDNLSVPLEIVVENNTSFNFQIDEWNLDNQDVFLYDTLANEYYKLGDEPIKIKLEKGTYTDRFFIRFKDENATLQVDSFLKNLLNTYYNKDSEEIVIKVPKDVVITDVELFSILGQKIGHWNMNDNNDLKIKVKNIATNVYIVKVKTDKGNITKKIIIN